LADEDAIAVAELVQDVRNALEHLRRAQGYGRITVEVTVANGVIARWEIAPHLSRKPGYGGGEREI
jgi:hypothetical protein